MQVLAVDDTTGSISIADNSIFIDENGNVGIGTIEPTQRLDVNGKLRVRSLALDNTKDSILVACGDGTLAFREASSLTTGGAETDPEVGANTTNQIPKWDGSALVSGTLTDTSGKIGIGASIPSQLLHIEGASGLSGATPVSILLNSSENGTWTNESIFAQLQFGNDDVSGAGSGGVKAKIAAYLDNIGGEDNGLSFYTSTDGTSIVEGMRINHTGSLGIGTTSPSQKLDVNGKARIRDLAAENLLGEVLVVESNGTIHKRDIDLFGGQWRHGFSGEIYNYHDGNVSIGSNAANNRLTVSGSADISGNLGIGITGPTADLEVYGGSPLIKISNTAENPGSISFNDVNNPTNEHAELTYNAANNHLFLANGGAERLRITSTGNMYYFQPNGADFIEFTGTTTPIIQPSAALNGLLGTISKYWNGVFTFQISRAQENVLSDRRVKQNIRPLPGSSLSKLLQLEGVKFDINTDKHPFYDASNPNFDPEMAKNHLGFIAQDLKEVIPEMVKLDQESELYNIVNYEQLFPVIVEGIKEQQALIEAQQQQLDEQKLQIEDLINKLTTVRD
jgi:hypothetical protein